MTPRERNNTIAWGVHVALILGAWVALRRGAPDRPMRPDEWSQGAVLLPLVVFPSLLLWVSQVRGGNPIVGFVTSWLLGLMVGGVVVFFLGMATMH